jgi:hypothetical protein
VYGRLVVLRLLLEVWGLVGCLACARAAVWVVGGVLLFGASFSGKLETNRVDVYYRPKMSLGTSRNRLGFDGFGLLGWIDFGCFVGWLVV